MVQKILLHVIIFYTLGSIDAKKKKKKIKNFPIIYQNIGFTLLSSLPSLSVWWKKENISYKYLNFEYSLYMYILKKV